MPKKDCGDARSASVFGILITPRIEDLTAPAAIYHVDDSRSAQYHRCHYSPPDALSLCSPIEQSQTICPQAGETQDTLSLH